MFDRIPANFAQQPLQADVRQTADKTSVTTSLLRQQGTDVENKMVQPTREFPEDSANISEEARRAFEEKDRIRRREEEERRRQGGGQQQKKKKNPRNPYSAYQQESPQSGESGE